MIQKRLCFKLKFVFTCVFIFACFHHYIYLD